MHSPTPSPPHLWQIDACINQNKKKQKTKIHHTDLICSEPQESFLKKKRTKEWSKLLTVMSTPTSSPMHALQGPTNTERRIVMLRRNGNIHETPVNVLFQRQPWFVDRIHFKARHLNHGTTIGEGCIAMWAIPSDRPGTISVIRARARCQVR